MKLKIFLLTLVLLFVSSVALAQCPRYTLIPPPPTIIQPPPITYFPPPIIVRPQPSFYIKITPYPHRPLFNIFTPWAPVYQHPSPKTSF